MFASITYFRRVPIKRDLAMEMLNGSAVVRCFLCPAPNTDVLNDALPFFFRLSGSFFPVYQYFQNEQL